jgi:putative flippase GtrA
MHSRSRRWVRFGWQRLSRPMGKWWIVNLAFWLAGLGVLYVLIDLLRIPLMLGTVLAAEITTLLRFVINDRWVFGYHEPTWARLWQFHVACAGGAAIWWCIANPLARVGVHYLVASSLGSAASALFSVTTNFNWVWRARDTSSSEEQSRVAPEAARSANAE